MNGESSRTWPWRLVHDRLLQERPTYIAFHRQSRIVRSGASPQQNGATGVTSADVLLKRFEAPDEIREFTRGRVELVRIGGLTIARATYEPGWRWSEHVGPTVGASRCTVEHVGLVLSGTATAAFADGGVIELRAGEIFYIPPLAHDSWVVGNVPYVSLHFLGAEAYARKSV
jgi:hypothetical protein